MPNTEAKSKNPMYPDADPTAPGGMSRKALIKELEYKHGYEGDWSQVKWPDLIDMVCQERLAREAEAKQIMAVTYAEPVDSTVPMGVAFPDATPETNADVAKMFATDMFDALDDEPEVCAYDGDHDMLCVLPEDLMAELDDPAGELLGVLTPLIEDIAAEYDEREDAGFEADHPDGEMNSDDATDFFRDEAEDGVLDPEQMFAELAAAREAVTPPPIFIGLPVVKDYVFDGHAGAGPSGAERWMNCTMSLTASRRFLETLSPNQQRTYAGANTAARQGTTAHSAAEVEANFVLGRSTQEEVDYTLLELSITPEDEGEAYDDEMGEYITEYVDLVKSYAQERGNDHVLVESRVEAAIPLTHMHEGEVYVIRGSADMVALPTKAEPTLVVGDLKYGTGLDVDVNENPQIRLYALGVLELLADPETGELPTWLNEVVYHIIQPRLGGIKTSTETIDALLEWRDEVLAPALTLALYGEDEGATFEPSELACQWCPARGGCPALIEQRMDQAASLFDVIVESEFENGPGTFPETSTLSNERLGELLAQAAGLHNIFKDLKEEAQRRLHRGSDVPGYWLVNYSPKRHWADGAVEKLENEPRLWTDPTLMSPPQAEKVLGKEEFAKIEALVVKPDKVPLISTGPGDRRSKWDGKPPEQMFPDMEEEA